MHKLNCNGGNMHFCNVWYIWLVHCRTKDTNATSLHHTRATVINTCTYVHLTHSHIISNTSNTVTTLPVSVKVEIANLISWPKFPDPMQFWCPNDLL